MTAGTKHFGRAGYLWAAGGAALSTVCLWLVRGYLDKGQASLLYLPIVIACAIRFGFGPALLGAGLTFLCWLYFFLPPFFTFVVTDPKDWISLFVFLVAALTTAHLAARGREQTQQARAREAEISVLFQASEALSREVNADNLLATLAHLLQTRCQASRCLVFRRDAQNEFSPVASPSLGGDVSAGEAQRIRQMAQAAYDHCQIIGLGAGQNLWAKALGATRQGGPVESTNPGIYIPLQAEKRRVGVLHVGPRTDGLPFSATDVQLVLTLANHAAVVIAREFLAEQAAQADALREADTLKNSLLSLVSHELRTPLATIKASVTGLLDTRAVWDDAARADSLRGVNRETDRLTAVVGNLLNLSRLEAGVWQPEKDWCDIAEIVATVKDRLPDDQAGRVKVEIDEVPLLRVDYTQIALVLFNLLENAVKYAPAHSPIHLSAALAPDGQAADGIKLAVRDFGAGICPGEEERLFERFYRGEAHRDSALHGTGLGLALCQVIADAHGGRIWAHNAPAGEPSGAVFTLFLPTDYIPERPAV